MTQAVDDKDVIVLKVFGGVSTLWKEPCLRLSASYDGSNVPFPLYILLNRSANLVSGGGLSASRLSHAFPSWSLVLLISVFGDHWHHETLY